MTNDRHEPGGGPDEERRPRRDRDTSDENPWLSDQAKSIFLELGVNIRNPDSVEAFNEALDWAMEGARRRKWWREMRSRVVVGCLVAAGGGAAVSAISWLTSHTFGNGH